MIDREIADKVLTIGPAPDMKGGIAQVLDTYFTDIFQRPKFIAETIDGAMPLRVGASALAAVRLVWRLATDRDIRVVHLHTATKVSFPRSSVYAAIARAFGRKTVMHIHGANFDDYYRAHQSQVGRALRAADRVVALSDTWRKFLTQEVGLDNVIVIPNIVSAPNSPRDNTSGDETGRGRPSSQSVGAPNSPRDNTWGDETGRGRPSSQSVGAAHTDTKVHGLFLGLIGDRKGLFDLLQVLHDEHERLRGRFVLHVGGNGEVQRLHDEIQRLDIADLVEFHGWVRADDKARLLRQSSIYLLPSYGEGLPISILEAMTYGNAVISTRIGGIPEVVDDTNGALITPGDRQALAEALIRMVDDHEQTAAMGRRSIDKATPYLAPAVERCLTDMYLELLASESPR